MSEKLVQQLARNPKDQDRWVAFYNKLRPKVYFAAYRECHGERDLADELTQEAFVRFFKYADLHLFESDDHALAYLRLIVRHRFVTHVRRFSELRHAISLDEIEDLVAPESSEDWSVRADLETLAAHLDSTDRLLLERLMAGDPVQKIATEFNLSRGATAVRIHRLIRKMRPEFSRLGASK